MNEPGRGKKSKRAILAIWQTNPGRRFEWTNTAASSFRHGYGNPYICSQGTFS